MISDRQQPASPTTRSSSPSSARASRARATLPPRSRCPARSVVAACDSTTAGWLTRRSAGARTLHDSRLPRTHQPTDIDAVIVAVPDHWHRQIAVDALGKNKSVYLEKPMVQQLGEARPSSPRRSVERHPAGRSQGCPRSAREGQELLAAGAIGTLNYAEGFWARNSPSGAWQYAIPPEASEQTLDWDKFLGARPSARTTRSGSSGGATTRTTAPGVCGDLFVHLFSTLHFITARWARRRSWPRAACGSGRTDVTCLT